MEDYNLDPGEFVIMQETPAELHSGKTVDKLDEVVLTNRHLILVCSQQQSLFQKRRLLKRCPLEQTLDSQGFPQVVTTQLRDKNILQVLFSGENISVSFPNKSKHTIERWAEGIRNAAVAEPVVAHPLDNHLLSGDGGGMLFGMNLASAINPLNAGFAQAAGTGNASAAGYPAGSGAGTTPSGANGTPAQATATNPAEQPGAQGDQGNGAAQDSETQQPSSSFNDLDERIEALRKLKDLADAGILTQEEFDQKKKQLLNL